jgi:hypothetical protein
MRRENCRAVGEHHSTGSEERTRANTYAALSHDGHRLAFVNNADEIAIVDLRRGTSRS